MKKFAIPLTILYDALMAFWCVLVISNLIYYFTDVSVNDGSIGIIGGGGMPTLLFKLKFMFLMRNIVALLGFILNIISAVFLTISTFKKQANFKLYIITCVFLGLTLISFLLTPEYSFMVSAYAFVRSIWLFKALQISHIVILVLNIFHILRRMSIKS